MTASSSFTISHVVAKAEVGHQRVEIKTNNFQHLLITITLIAAAISVEDSDEVSDDVDVTILNARALSAVEKRGS